MINEQIQLSAHDKAANPSEGGKAHQSGEINRRQDNLSGKVDRQGDGQAICSEHVGIAVFRFLTITDSQSFKVLKLIPVQGSVPPKAASAQRQCSKLASATGDRVPSAAHGKQPGLPSQ